MSRVLDVVGETTDFRGHTHGDGHGFFERLPHKSPFGAITKTSRVPFPYDMIKCEKNLLRRASYWGSGVHCNT